MPTRTTAIVPLRGNSKGVPRKNLRPLNGHPLVWHTIQAAQSAREIDRLIISTDDERVAEYVASLSVEVFVHPSALSVDGAPSAGVVWWDLAELSLTNALPDICVVLRATTPLRDARDIDTCVEMLRSRPTADSIVSVTEAVGISPARLKRLTSDGRLIDSSEFEGWAPKPRQVYEPLYIRNGGVYAFYPSKLSAGMLWGPECLAYVMPESRSININTEFQFQVAECLLMTAAISPSATGKPETNE